MKINHIAFTTTGSIEITTDRGLYIIEGRPNARDKGNILKQFSNSRNTIYHKHATSDDKYKLLSILCRETIDHIFLKKPK